MRNWKMFLFLERAASLVLLITLSLMLTAGKGVTPETIPAEIPAEEAAPAEASTEEAALAENPTEGTISTETPIENTAEEAAPAEAPTEETISTEIPAEATISTETPIENPAEEAAPAEDPADETISTETPTENPAEEAAPAAVPTEEAISTEETISTETPTEDTAEEAALTETSTEDTILAQMSTEEKIAQMIMPAFRYYTDEEGKKQGMAELTDDAAESLRRHGFAGVVLFAQNTGDTAAAVKLVDNMQKANAAVEGRTQLLVAIDQEGGSVTRLGHGTQMPGNMALGAANDKELTAEAASVIGQEIMSMGINFDFAPVLDVNSNPANPVIGTRSFSDDASIVAAQGVSFMKALQNTGAISTLKHFPGHGDTATDSHTGLPLVDKSYEELEARELVPFQAAIKAGAEAVMTAHIQYPQIETKTYTSKSTEEQVYLPATLSETILTGILRHDMGFEGVILTDAMEMAAISKHFGPYDAAMLAINAGVDILLMPVDTSTTEGALDGLDTYIQTLADLVESGKIDREKVDAAVLRIWKLKAAHGLTEPYSGIDADASRIVGSAEHHEAEWELTKKTVTLVKNDNSILPLTRENQKIAVLTAYDNEVLSMEYAVNRLRDEGKLAEGSEITVKSIRKKTAEEAIECAGDAEHVIIITELGSAAGLNNDTAKTVDALIESVHQSGGDVIIMSCSLPYDAARYQAADAIVLAWSARGMTEDPRTVDGAPAQYGPSMPAALYLMLSPDESPAGKLPVNLPKLTDEMAYSNEVLYPRGFGLHYAAFREEDAARLTEGMTLEQKVAQMIMPAMRTWGSERKSVQVLSEFPDLAEALRRHQYGGVILFGSNISNTAQTVRLISDLQANNAQSADAETAGVIPYLVSADQEGGSVARLTMGTRGTGSMAIGATGDEQSALSTGRVFGEELAALGINVNLGPCVDVITDLTDLGMSTRVFSDDPETAAKLGTAFMNGVSESGVITTYKHFPGAGDGSDYPTSIKLTREQLEETGLLAYRMAVENGAEMVMTSATTFPLIDDEVLMADGVTKGYYPATLSQEFVTEMLRKDLAFDGVVITDALEMEQFVTEPDNGKELFSGEYGSVEHDLQVAERAINAGCDILLIPTDLIGEEAAQYYDEYIAGIVGLIKGGAVSEERVNEAVRRILELKIRHGLFDMDTSGADIERKIETAEKTVGSAAHHKIEADIAAKAVTLLKNDQVLPLSGNGKRIVILGRTTSDNTPVTYALDWLMNNGFIDKEARIENRISGENRGDENAATNIVIDHYYQRGALSYSDELTAAIQNADAVVCLCAVGAGIGSLQDDSVTMQGVSRALADAHAAGKKFVLLSDNLPVDAARFQDADAIVCAYLSAGFGIDPTVRTSGFENVGAFNANVPAALYAIFGAADTPGSLPINIPVLEQDADGKWVYGDTILYERGTHHSVKENVEPEPEPDPKPTGKCYVATAVYGSYDCPEVRTLRRFRDEVLAKTWYGRLFIRTYYATSPTAVKLFGESDWFQNTFRGILDDMVSDLHGRLRIYP